MTPWLWITLFGLVVESNWNICNIGIKVLIIAQFICILPVISTQFEALVYNQICEYLDADKMLSGRQSGFWSLQFTYLLNCIDDWYINMDNYDYTALDLKRAFDTVNHAILLKTIGNMALQGLK